jgi:large subunit ribosomal protein L21
MVVDGDDISVGTPTVGGIKVNTTVMDHIKGPKIIVFKYSPKKRIRVKRGHRQQYTRLMVDAIGADSKASKAKKAEAPAEETTEAKAEKKEAAAKSTTKEKKAEKAPAKKEPAKKAKKAPAKKTTTKKTTSKSSPKEKKSSSTKKTEK